MVPEIEAVGRDYARGLIREIYEVEDRQEVEEMLANLPLAKAGFWTLRSSN
jgi:hypothetical protein